MRRAAFSLAFFLALIIALPAHAQNTSSSPAAKRNLTIDDYFQIARVGDPQISPDGKWVAYTVNRSDLKEDKSETQIWRISTDGGTPMPMTAKGNSASSPRWSPDGKYLSFTASRGEGRSQVWLLDRNGGEAQQLTDVKQGVQSHLWSPDGSKLALIVRDPSPEDLPENKDKPKAKTPKPWVIDRLQFKRDVAGYLDRRRSHIFVFDVASKKLTQVTSGDFDDSQPAWSPDGKKIAFTSNRTQEPDSNRNTDIFVVAADNSDQGKTLQRITDNPGSDASPAWSPDGKWIAYVTVTDISKMWYATHFLAIVASAGGAPTVISQKTDRNVSGPKFIGDGSSIAFILEDHGETHVAEMRVNGGSPTRLDKAKGSVGNFQTGKDGSFVFAMSGPMIPSEIFVQSGNDLRRLTHTNDDLLAQLSLSDAEKFTSKSKDGTPIEYYFYKPANYQAGQKVPALLRPHGGPVGQYENTFSFEAQLFAANGYAVILPNPRGSSGYGQAFCSAIWADWGNKDFEDVMSSADDAVARGVADPDKLGVGGWSYGGIMTNNVITKTGRFKAAITGASEVNYVSNYGHDHYQYEYETELGLPWRTKELWDRISPFTYIEKVTTPTLIMGGEKDWNVPILNSEQLYQALKRLGRTTQLVVYPGESHGFTKPSYIKDRWERYLAWYGKFVKNETTETKAEGN